MKQDYLYRLNKDHTVEVMHDTNAWSDWFDSIDNTIAVDCVAKDVSVSTVFLGIDYNVLSGPPLMFETMVFGGARNDESQRYGTYEEAVLGHIRMVWSFMPKVENHPEPYELGARKIRIRNRSV